MAELQYALIVEWIGFFCVLAILSPLVPSKRWRYYACYVCYVTVLSLFAIILCPIIALRPRNIVNLKMSAFCLRPFTKIIGIDWELRNGQFLKEDRGAVICANHQSIFDIMGMFNIWDVMDKCTAVARKELLYVIPFGPMAWMCGLVFIDRVDPKGANVKLSAASRIINSLKAKFWLFPEGTRNKKAADLLPFKRGAFKIAIEAQVPIIPIVYSPYYFINSKAKSFGHGKIIISVLDSISTKGLTLEDIDSLRFKTHEIMSEEYNKLKDEISRSQNNNLHCDKSLS
uniref:1-acyl-sn-glycerol-3-phosphate acyltransferase n=1 Tax=Riptortus pedestris TaxID=329032 RepID=R4WDV3_RIPPE|nr:1-acyl-sn-glycerol-3-phosphate acyltransferase [Riptortus pedestris]